MAVALAPASPPRAAPRARDRAHWWLLAALSVIVAGFWPSFFSPRATSDVAHALHGVSATGWVVALASQAWLIGRKRRDWHRRVAVAAIPLALVLVVTALPMVRAMLITARQNAAFRPVAYQLAVYDVASLTLFAGLLSVALAYVRRPALHRRCLSATVLLAMPPGLGRLLARIVPGLELPAAAQAALWVGDTVLLRPLDDGVVASALGSAPTRSQLTNGSVRADPVHPPPTSSTRAAGISAHALLTA